MDDDIFIQTTKSYALRTLEKINSNNCSKKEQLEVASQLELTDLIFMLNEQLQETEDQNARNRSEMQSAIW